MNLEFKQRNGEDYFALIDTDTNRVLLIVDYDSVFASINQYNPRIFYAMLYHQLSVRQADEVNKTKSEFIATQNVIRRLKA